MDLETLQSQMKVVIQKHQIVVTEMKKDPQNPVLQKQLRDLNSEIMSLSEKQKQIMQHLRSNLQKKQQHCPITSSSGNPSAVVPGLCTQNTTTSDVRMVCTAQKPVVNHRLASPVQTVTLAPNQVPNFINSLHQPVPTNINNIVSSSTTLTFKGPVGTVVLPNCSGTTALIANKTVDHQKLHPVLVVPTPSTRSADGAQTGVLLNIVPPIRVPQYPPPLQPVPRQPSSAQPQRYQNSSSFVPVCATTSASVTTTTSPSVSSPSGEKSSNVSPLPSSVSPVSRTNCQSEKLPVVPEIDPEKREFMLALGLASRDLLYDMKNKKNERKRRTTANPQFSNAALEEKLQRAAAAQAAGGASLKRPRGRPRLDSKPLTCTSNGVNSLAEAAGASNGPPSPVTTCSGVGRIPCNTSVQDVSSPVQAVTTTTTTATPTITTTTTTTVVNGINHQVIPSSEDKKVEQLLSGLCIVCTQPGDLVKCDSCAKQQHLKCMQPPLPSKPEGKWQCSECQSRTDTLAAVHSYEMLKTAKEDEKRKLLKKSLELRLKRSQLEGKLYHLREIIAKQRERQSELHSTLQRVEGSLDLFQSVVSHVRQFS